MLLRTAIGHEIKSYCILDSDFHTPKQIKQREDEAQDKGINLHIWKLKEVENYLLVPAAILRSLEGRNALRQNEPGLSEELISRKLFELAGTLEHEVMDAYASEFLPENRAGGPAQANKMARQIIYPNWNTDQGRLSLVSGKQLLGMLAAWTQEHYGVGISAARVARAMRRSEIADEVAEVL